ncbi:aspartate 1-decarboxylase [Alicyclobacillaceae bacterium I2511]|nr:aspartate 1-decarboxylase [Alicyclobacillaceae bacterium I2511]
MWQTFCMGKIHRATVTQADLNYVGSITLDPLLMEAAHILPLQMVQITNLANGMLWHTYALEGQRGSGVVCLNGPPARHFQPGDLVIILSTAQVSDVELPDIRTPVVFVDAQNKITQVLVHTLVRGHLETTEDTHLQP